MAYPLLYSNVSLPTATHLAKFTRTLALQPAYGLWTRSVPTYPREPHRYTH